MIYIQYITQSCRKEKNNVYQLHSNNIHQQSTIKHYIKQLPQREPKNFSGHGENVVTLATWRSVFVHPCSEMCLCKRIILRCTDHESKHLKYRRKIHGTKAYHAAGHMHLRSILRRNKFREAAVPRCKAAHVILL